MSNLTANEVNGLMEAYEAVYDPDLREALEEEKELEKEILENVGYVLFSKGYNAINVLEYFTYTDQEVIIEDVISLAEGTLLFETVVSEQYIDEQFENLNEFVGAALRVGRAALQAAKYAPKGSGPLARIGSALTGAGKATTRVAAQGPKASAVVRPAISKAVSGLKSAAPAALKGAAGGAGKLLGKALPGAGAVLYGMDAVDRAKKGDWGGAALSGIGAATSFGGPLAALAPAGIQMATDAMGLTGDKSRKGAAPKSPTGDKSKWNASKALGGKAAFTAGGGKEKMKLNPGMSAADVQKQGMINIRNKKLAASPAPAAATPAPSATGRRSPSATPVKPPSAPKTTASDSKLTPMQQWAKAHPGLASGVKPGQAGYDEISATREKPGPNEKQDQTPTQGPKTTPEQDKDFAQQAAQATADFQKREQEKLKKQQETQQKQTVNASYEYDAFDLVLEYLTSEGHVDTLDEALYVMMEMDVECIQSICGMYLDEAARRVPKKQRGAKPSDAEWQDSRSDAGKRISGDSKHGPRSYVLGRRTSMDAPTRPGEKPQGTVKLDNSEREELAYRKEKLKNR